jgi:hypothetical protein
MLSRRRLRVNLTRLCFNLGMLPRSGAGDVASTLVRAYDTAVNLAENSATARRALIEPAKFDALIAWFHEPCIRRGPEI